MEEENKIPAPFGTQPQNENNSEQPELVPEPDSSTPAEIVRNISIEEAFSFGWKTFKANMSLLILLTLAYFVITIAESILQKGAKGEDEISLAVSVATIVLNIFIGIGVIQVFLKISRGGQAKISEIFGNAKYFWKFVGGSLLYVLIVAAGYLLLIIPGIIWQFKYGFYSYLIIDKDMGPVDAIKESGRMTYGFKWKIFLLQLSILAICLVGLLFFGVGLFVAYPLSLLMMVYAYRKLIGERIEIAA